MSSEASEDPSFGLHEDEEEEEEEVSEVDSNDGTRIDWNSLTPPVWVKRNVTPEEHPFEEKKKLGRPKQHSALDLFLTFFAAELMQNICIWTTSHASTKNVDLELDVPLLRAFIGLSLLMGIVQKSDVKDYWSTDHEIATPFFPATMPRRTYLNILYKLGYQLLQWKLHFCGTVKKKPYLPAIAYPKKAYANPPKKKGRGRKPKPKLKRGATVTYKCGDVKYFHFFDKRDVRMISTLPLSGTDTYNQTEKGGAEVEFEKPAEVKMYNRYMGGVDLSDQRMALACREFKTKVWYRKFFWYFLEGSVQNASSMGAKKVPLSDFKRELAQQLIDGKTWVAKDTKPPIDPNGHFLEQGKRGICAWETCTSKTRIPEKRN